MTTNKPAITAPVDRLCYTCKHYNAVYCWCVNSRKFRKDIDYCIEYRPVIGKENGGCTRN